MSRSSPLHQHRVAILATHGFEEREVLEPLRALREAGADVDVIGLDANPIQAMHLHFKTSLVYPDRVLSNTVLPEQYNALILPGGPIHADTMRGNSMVLNFVRAMHEAEKPIGAISHAAWILISAGVVSGGRKITGFHTLREDVINAGGYWFDDPVVIHDHFITARDTHDLAAFNSALIQLLSQHPALISPETRQLMARSRIA